MSETIISTKDPARTIVQNHPDCVTRGKVIADGSDDAEVVDLSSWAGASSEAHPSKGIPSARVQRTHQPLSTEPTTETTRAGRVEPMNQNLKP